MPVGAPLAFPIAIIMVGDYTMCRARILLVGAYSYEYMQTDLHVGAPTCHVLVHLFDSQHRSDRVPDRAERSHNEVLAWAGLSNRDASFSAYRRRCWELRCNQGNHVTDSV